VDFLDFLIVLVLTVLHRLRFIELNFEANPKPFPSIFSDFFGVKSTQLCKIFNFSWCFVESVTSTWPNAQVTVLKVDFNTRMTC